MARALVTGGGGFIGAWIARRLTRQGIAVRVFDLGTDRSTARGILGSAADELEWRTGDVSDAGALPDAAGGCDLLVHLAAILTPACQADPLRGAQINLLGTLNVFETARALGIGKVLYMSSAGVLHFVNPAFYVALIPPFLPAPLFLVYASGVAELVTGLGLLWPRCRRVAAERRR